MWSGTTIRRLQYLVISIMQRITGRRLENIINCLICPNELTIFLQILGELQTSQVFHIENMILKKGGPIYYKGAYMPDNGRDSFDFCARMLHREI